MECSKRTQLKNISKILGVALAHNVMILTRIVVYISRCITLDTTKPSCQTSLPQFNGLALGPCPFVKKNIFAAIDVYLVVFHGFLCGP